MCLDGFLHLGFLLVLLLCVQFGLDACELL
jgi:hypothetical protein